MHSREYYYNLRGKYIPEDLKLVFLAESPPASGAYFYDPAGKVTEQLFSAMMRDVIEIAPATKEEGLRKFASAGFLLVDATYKPVNKGLTRKKRDEIILGDFDRLLADFNKLAVSREVGIILIKANVCRLLERRLSISGFNVLNSGLIVPFPGSGQHTNFRNSVKRLL